MLFVIRILFLLFFPLLPDFFKYFRNSSQGNSALEEQKAPGCSARGETEEVLKVPAYDFSF